MICRRRRTNRTLLLVLLALLIIWDLGKTGVFSWPIAWSLVGVVALGAGKWAWQEFVRIKSPLPPEGG